MSGITSDVANLQTAINGIMYKGSLEDGLQAMASVLPGDFDDAGFSALLDSRLELNNVIVSHEGNRFSELGGLQTSGDCAYIPASRPSGGGAALKHSKCLGLVGPRKPLLR